MDFKSFMNSLPNQKTEEMKAIAELTESSMNAVYKWVAGTHNVPKLKKKIIAEHLGKPISELWPDEKDE